MYKYSVAREINGNSDTLKLCDTPAEATTLLQKLEDIGESIGHLHVEVAKYGSSGKTAIESFTSEEWKEYGEKRYSDIIDAIS